MSFVNTKMKIASAIFAVLLGATGCASSPYSADGKAKSDAVLNQQLSNARVARAQGDEPRVLFAGFALHSQSKAFRQDVETGASFAQKLDDKAIVFKLANPAFGGDNDLPFATKENVELVIREMKKIARKNDKIVLLLSTHGNVNMLGVNAANQNYPPITPKELEAWLDALGDQPAVVILSACFSGSFIDLIQLRSRIILTAAAKDRASFGCNFHSDNTYFIADLLGTPFNPETTMNRLFDDAKSSIYKLEVAKKLSPPSNPQRFVGADARGLAQVPLSQFRQYEATAK